MILNMNDLIKIFVCCSFDTQVLAEYLAKPNLFVSKVW